MKHTSESLSALLKKHEDKVVAAPFVAAANLGHLSAVHFLNMDALVAELNAEEAPAPPAPPAPVAPHA